MSRYVSMLDFLVTAEALAKTNWRIKLPKTSHLPPQWKLDFEEWWARHQDQLDCSKATAFEVWKGACCEE